jgi:hypothetical protein
MFGANLNAGIRYLLPVLPPLCVWLGGFAAHPARVAPARAGERKRWAMAGALLVAVQAAEVLPAAPRYISYFNPAARLARTDFLLNDSNVDWGQGLIALREDMKRFGIRRIHLAYHGTTDPAVYGIDYLPYFGGTPGPESEWLAVSSYYFVGLKQKMMTRLGPTEDMKQFDFRPLWSVAPVSRPAGCMYLFRLPR